MLDWLLQVLILYTKWYFRGLEYIEGPMTVSQLGCCTIVFMELAYMELAYNSLSEQINLQAGFELQTLCSSRAFDV